MIITAQVTPARRVLHRSRVVRLAAHALSNGGVRKTLTHVHWDASGRCEAPQLIELEGRLNEREKASRWEPTEHANILALWVGNKDPVYRFADLFPHEAPIVVTMEVPCRRCGRCLRRRAAHWRARAMAEINGAPRTWFGTITLAPEHHLKAEYAAHSRLLAGGTVFAKLSEAERFREVHTEHGRELTKWLKRVRKESEATLRYILVAEAHKSGNAHYHCLIHETVGGGSVKERTLRTQWKLGHSKFNLVGDKRAAGYVCKYLSKSVLCRVRASKNYGTILVPTDIASIMKRESRPSARRPLF